MEPNGSSDTTFSGRTAAIGKALLDSPVMRSWPPTLAEAQAILATQPYEVLERIGHGGMGAVFKVRNLEPGMGRFEAVKIRRPEARDDDLFRERFLREIGTLAQLRHSGITTVFRSGDSAEGYLWFSMEFLEGRSLAELLAPGLPPLSPERVLDITRQLCITLKFIHQAGRLHRDLKPANVMVCDDGSVRLLDFGIARPAEPSPINLLTRPGDNPHTPDYASPEQKTGGPVDERTDLYGLGRIVTDMIGPIHAGTREHQPRFPQRLLDLADDLLAYDRNDRPNSAADVIEKLGQLEPGSPGFWGKDHCPFRGLEAYQPEHAELFFGRDAAIRRGLEILQPGPDTAWNGFLLITGASGSGKSSLARAGLGPALLRSENTTASDNTNIVPVICDLSTIRPENDCLLPPLARLLAAAVPGKDPSTIAAALRDPGTDLALSLGPKSNNNKPFGICLILDQFEHFFRLNLLRSAQARFLTAIARLSHTAGFAILVTLRSDSYYQCAHYPALMELKDGRQLDVAPPQPWELAAVLRLSARAAGLTFETSPDGRSLDDILLEHARCNPQSLPLLSYVLEELWEHRNIVTNTLRFADYEALGGFEGAVGIKAKDTLSLFAEDFPNNASAALDDLLHLVVEASESGNGDTFVRRRASPEELLEAPAPVRHLAERLVAARLLVQDSSGLTLAHEALLSAAVVSRWDAMIAWLANNVRNLRVRKRVAMRCRDWLSDGRPADLLLSAGVLLSDADALLDARSMLFSAEQREFIKQSAATAAEPLRRASRRRRLILATIVVLTLTTWLYAIAVNPHQPGTTAANPTPIADTPDKPDPQPETRPEPRPELKPEPQPDSTTPAVANSLRKVKVPSDAATIAKAIELCKEGGTVEIAGGTYREAIQLVKSISLVADPSAVLENDKSNVIVARGAIKVTLRNLQIKNPSEEAKLPPDKSPALVVIIEGAELHFDGCVLEKSNGDGVSVVKKAFAKFSNSRIHDNRGYGVNVRDASRVEMSLSEIRKNGFSGISIVNGGSKGTLGNSTTIAENNKNGVEVGNGASLEGKGVTITENHKSGLAIQSSGSKAALDDSCVFSSNGDYGIIAADAVRLTLSNSTCSGNKEHGLYMTKGAAAEITSCHFKSNGVVGIFQDLGTSGSVKVSKTNFQSHPEAGVVVGEGSGEISDCVFSANKIAVLFGENAGGSATGNLIQPGPLADVLIIDPPAKVRAENNTIDSP